MPNKLYGPRDYVRLSGADGVDSGRERGWTAFKKDYARLLHAPSFRRLQGKTQLFPGIESDFFRNRLTHSLEVAQIACGIALAINDRYRDELEGQAIDCDLVQFAALAHDLGHPPFGHNGEKALDSLMCMRGGFEGNAQTLHIVASVERKIVAYESDKVRDDCGLNLTFRSLASVLKYDRKIDAERAASNGLQKGYYASDAELVQEIKNAVAPGYTGAHFKTIECSIMDLADDIAYSTYDLEDSLHAGFVSPFSLVDALLTNEQIGNTVLRRCNEALYESGYESLPNVGELVQVTREIFSGLIDPPATDEGTVGIDLRSWANNNILVADSRVRTSFTAERVGWLIDQVELVLNAEFPQLSKVRLKRCGLIRVEVLKHLNFELVIRSPRLAIVEHRGRELVTDLFNTLLDSEGSLLPLEWKDRYNEDEMSDADKARLICDYVACMTDSYAAGLHDRLFGKGASIFQPL